MIKRKIINLVTMFTTPQPYSKKVFFFFILALNSIRHGYKKRNLIFIEPLL